MSDVTDKFPECSSPSLSYTTWNYKTMFFEFVEDEENSVAAILTSFSEMRRIEWIILAG